MNGEQIKMLLKSLKQNNQHKGIRCHETHISWLIFDQVYAYKIKKPLKTSFLDFSSVGKRRYYCQQEIKLNKRTAPKIYLEVMPVNCSKERFSFDKNGKKIDYAVKMYKMDTSNQMDILLQKKKINKKSIIALVHEIAIFHRNAKVVRKENTIQNMKSDLKDIHNQKENFIRLLGKEYWLKIEKQLSLDLEFIAQNKAYILWREKEGFTRDIHGDLHPGNIILNAKPILFDCLEFNTSLRQIDVLSEIAFVCMELEKYGLRDLSHFTYDEYLNQMNGPNDNNTQRLWSYYKRFRASVRAKVEIRKATDTETNPNMIEATKYISLWME